MSKTLLKLSTLFLAIFAIFLFIFFKTTQAEPIESHKHICTCLNTITATQEIKTYTNPNPDTKTICENACNYTKDGVKHKLLKYQHDNDSPKVPEQDPGEALKDLLVEHKYSCTCQDDNKSQYSITNPDDCSFKCLGAGYEVTKRVDAETVCHCPNGQDFSKAEGTTCDIVCKDQTTTGQTPPDQGQQPATGAVCTCKNKETDTSSKDKATCDSFCQVAGRNGVETYPSEQQTPSPPSTGTRIENPLKGINNPADLIKTIINFVLGFVGALAVLMIIYAGFIYMTSRGNEKQIEAAKNSLTYAIIGLVVVFASIIIVNAVIKAIGG